MIPHFASRVTYQDELHLGDRCRYDEVYRSIIVFNTLSYFTLATE